MIQEIMALRRMMPVTTNVETDGFGAFRDWGRRGWSPEKDYAPIHTGRDYGIIPDHIIRMPINGTAWGDWRPHPVGSYIMILPSINGSPAQHSAIYLIHCEPTSPDWLYHNRGQFLTEHAGYGVGDPHVHVEVAVTPALGAELHKYGYVDMVTVQTNHWLMKAQAFGYDEEEVLAAIAHQVKTFGLEEVTNDVLVRSGYPEYRQSQHSLVGKGETWIIDPVAFTAGGEEVSAA